MDHLSNPAEALASEPVEAIAAEASVAQAQPKEEFPSLPDVPDVDSPVFDYCDSISFFCYSLRGSSHEKSGMPCQDRCFSKYVKPDGYLIIAIADGVGSCALSDLGAHVAVHTSVDFLAEKLSQLPKKDFTVEQIGQLLRKMMQITYDAVEKTAEDAQQLLFSLQSTLTVAIYDGRDLYFAHAGDDGIVALNTDGCLQLATVRHKGEEASSVYPLQSINTWQYGMFKNTAAFVLATDGVLDSFVSTAYENNRIYYPFIQQAFSAKITSAMDTKDICYEMFTQMQEPEFRNAVTDDLTIAVVTNQKKIHTCLPDFDQDHWDADTRRYKEARYQALYGKNEDSASHDDTPSENMPEYPKTVPDIETASPQVAETQCDSRDIADVETQTQHDPNACSGNDSETPIPVPVSTDDPSLKDGKHKHSPFRGLKQYFKKWKDLTGNKAAGVPCKNSTSSRNEIKKASREDWRKCLADMLIYILHICIKVMFVLLIFAIFCLLYFCFLLPHVIQYVLDAIRILATLL